MQNNATVEKPEDEEAVELEETRFSNYLVFVTFMPGTRIETACKEACRIAALIGRAVGFSFNGCPLVARLDGVTWRDLVRFHDNYFVRTARRGVLQLPELAAGVLL